MSQTNEPREPWLAELIGEAADKRMTDKQIRILEASVELFAGKGYASASTSEIAAMAGVAEGTIFRHYKTKKELLLTIVRPAMIKLLAPFMLKEFKDVLSSSYSSYGDFLRALAANRIQFLDRNKRLVRILIQELPFHPELQQQFREHVFSRVIAQAEAIVIRFQQQGEIIPLPPATVLRLSASSLLGYAAARYIAQESASTKWNDERELSATIDFIVKGLRP
ncbi:TetR/AcrR family transcriptional regulator [Paenibacillus pasadenensis]|uniref:TetR/AcrR family transcriptional regulator n=1 Tax=Paenibacillus pasadenensis TaxID=217090 RepID=UPI002040BEBE|nr:TetR/AcrR family transcriptional regulator [Paenibacillus pasadenensis]MCM3747748.1 TetR/AcrR family transcriptional regulator [Paenibacillus pasadenensis]